MTNPSLRSSLSLLTRTLILSDTDYLPEMKGKNKPFTEWGCLLHTWYCERIALRVVPPPAPLDHECKVWKAEKLVRSMLSTVQREWWLIRVMQLAQIWNYFEGKEWQGMLMSRCVHERKGSPSFFKLFTWAVWRMLRYRTPSWPS